MRKLLLSLILAVLPSACFAESWLYCTGLTNGSGTTIKFGNKTLSNFNSLVFSDGTGMSTSPTGAISSLSIATNNLNQSKVTTNSHFDALAVGNAGTLTNITANATNAAFIVRTPYATNLVTTELVFAGPQPTNATVASGVTTLQFGAGGGSTVLLDTTLTAAVASVNLDLTASQDGRNLKIFVHARSDASGNQAVRARFNGDSGTNYDYQFVRGADGDAGAGRGYGVTVMEMGDAPGSDAPAGQFGAVTCHIPDYTSTNGFKSSNTQTYSRYTATNTFAGVFNGNWRSTAAITNLLIFPGSGNFVTGSRITVIKE